MEAVSTPSTMNADLLGELATKYGTPLYVYDSSVIAEQYHKLKQAFSRVDNRMMYACKALSNINILRLLKNMGAGLDTVSIEEVELGIKAGFAPEDIIFTPNCVSIEEYRQAAKHGVKINIDNISILEQFGHEFGDTYPVCIRVNPHILAGGNYKVSTGHIDSKFGISIYQMRHLERVIESTNIKVRGLHMHTGSEILDVGVFLRGVDILYDIARNFPELEFIDLGSGFKVAYSPTDNETDVDSLGKELSDSFLAFIEEYGKPLQLWFEPGKYIVSKSGRFLAKVNVVKTTTATVFAGVDSGFNHLIRPMLYDAYHHIENISNPEGIERIYTVVGNICETDTFAWDRKLSEVREGDILAFYNAGAYGFEMASHYNSRPRPAEVLLHDGKDHLIREREKLEDILKNQIEVDL